MKGIFHREITVIAIGERFSPPALDIVIAANLEQDKILGQLFHPEYHFDANHFQEGEDYIESQRKVVLEALQNPQKPSEETARSAFGHLIHAAQDFYAHSNYISLWIGRHTRGKRPDPEQTDALDPQLIQSPSLRSGKVYYPFELLSFIPALEPHIRPLLPLDSHARMNLDAPQRGPYFAYAYQAALKRTRYEFDRTTALLERRLGEATLSRFLKG
jgi:hypothetical protein